MQAVEEKILNVSLLEPRLKHPTVFSWFDALSVGESFILLNDHDPIPLFYEMKAERGEVFNWNKIENGPEVWRVEITKTPGELKAVNGIKETKNNGKQEDEIFTLNVTTLEPRMKHPTIFKYFDALKPGQAFRILNDHDPKPLYYQMLGERGNTFTWDYLQTGQWFIVQIRKNDAALQETMGEIATKDLRKAEVFKKYGLDFCCGGKKTVKEACEEKGLNVAQVEAELNQADSNPTSRPLPYNDWSLDFLADYIVNTHHSYVRKSLPDLRAYAAKVASVHGDRHPELLTVNKLVTEINEELTDHMMKEETVLFPFIKQLVNAKKDNQKLAPVGFGTVQNPINMMEHEHEAVGNNLAVIRSITNDYAIPQDACASYKLLFKMLEDFEGDLHTHIHLENNILFPKALKLEKEN